MDCGPRILSLCAGVGGLDLGVKLALPGARTVCFVERESFACEVLAHQMEAGGLDQAPVWTDLQTFDGAAWRGCVDILAAGYPCQPFSVTGKRKGEEDPRHLWPEVLRIAGEVRPRYLFLENVAGHLRLGFERVLGDLAELGFDAEWAVVRASDVGAPHRRARLFVLAHRTGVRESQSDGGECDEWGRVKHSGEGMADADITRLEGESWSEPDTAEPSARCRAMGNPDNPRLEGRGGPIPERSNERAAWPPSPEGDWSTVPAWLHPAVESSLCRVANGHPSRVDRLRALGNAVVPAQAAHALAGLIHRMNNRPPPV